jgi:hypothetical protein
MDDRYNHPPQNPYLHNPVLDEPYDADTARFRFFDPADAEKRQGRKSPASIEPFLNNIYRHVLTGQVRKYTVAENGDIVVIQVTPKEKSKLFRRKNALRCLDWLSMAKLVPATV